MCHTPMQYIDKKINRNTNDRALIDQSSLTSKLPIKNDIINTYTDIQRV